MRRLTFENEAFDEFTEWSVENKKLFDRIVKLLVEIRRTPFAGTGKPEALKHDYKGCWSRRIDRTGDPAGTSAYLQSNRRNNSCAFLP